jgi:hypothetical protein
MAPLRDETAHRLLESFRIIVAEGEQQLECLEQHHLSGQDDWGEDEDLQQVQCWWAVFRRRPLE